MSAASAEQVARRAIGLIDLTDLSDDATADGARAVCRRAAEHGTAAVCLWPDFVAEASKELTGTDVRVATVVNFPAGADRAFAVSVLTERCLADGADEIDVVLPYRAFVHGDEARAAAVLDAVRAVSDRALVKVILESGALGSVDAIRSAARFAIDHGADFVKTSTGKSEVSATLEAVAVMLDAVADASRPVGIKPSGGISSVEAAAGYLALADETMGPSWVSPATFRFGASGLLGVLVDVLEGVGPEGPGDDY